jgi:trimeric autotransporter adhesin
MRTNSFFLGTRRIGSATALAFAAAMICVLLLLFGSQATIKPAHAAPTFTVDRSDDPDLDTTPTADDCTAAEANDCSLRGAINAANNAPGPDTINFNIPGTGVKTIQVDGDDTTQAIQLPVIIEAVTIEGYTQSGATENTIPLAKDGTDANPLIVLNGGSIGGGSSGLRINASDVVVKGLVIKCFGGTGIFIQSGGSRAVIEGNFIGNEPPECSAGNGVVVFGGGANTIGGQEPAARNVISGNSQDGLLVADNGGNTIQGNLIGPRAKNGPNWPEPLGNSIGVEIGSPNNTVGNSTGDDEAGANLIAFNGTDGVKVNGGRNNAFAVGNRILSNSIFSNGDLGIDLDGGDPFDSVPDDGVTENDARAKDRDTGPNNLQNFPVLTRSKTTPSLINGTLRSRPNTTFTIQFFSSPAANPSGFGEGKTFLDQTQVTTNNKGRASFTFIPAPRPSGENAVTATATNDLTDDTSEFSKAVTAS